MQLINSLHNAAVFKTAILFSNKPIDKPVSRKVRIMAALFLKKQKVNNQRKYSAV